MNQPRLPNFIIAGAPRCATTWLYEAADRHPEIAMAKPARPEPKFFLVDELYERGLDYYCATWYAALPERRCYGEKSTNYLESVNACARIARDLPDVRLVFVLREPVSRAYSNYLWSVRNGLENESFDRALELEEERERRVGSWSRYARPHAYFSRGLYADLLAPWFQHFPREQILVLRTEDLRDNSQYIVGRMHAFVGVSPRPEIADCLGIINASKLDGSALIDITAREALSKRYRDPNLRLMRLLGPSFAGWSDREFANL